MFFRRTKKKTMDFQIYDDIDEEEIDSVLIEIDFNCKELDKELFKRFCINGFELSGIYRDEGTENFTLYRCINGYFETRGWNDILCQ